MIAAADKQNNVLQNFEPTLPCFRELLPKSEVVSELLKLLSVFKLPDRLLLDDVNRDFPEENSYQ